MTDFKFKSVFGPQPTCMINLPPIIGDSSSNKSSNLATLIAVVVISGVVIFAGYQLYTFYKKEEEKIN